MSMAEELKHTVLATAVAAAIAAGGAAWQQGELGKLRTNLYDRADEFRKEQRTQADEFRKTQQDQLDQWRSARDQETALSRNEVREFQREIDELRRAVEGYKDRIREVVDAGKRELETSAEVQLATALKERRHACQWREVGFARSHYGDEGRFEEARSAAAAEGRTFPASPTAERWQWCLEGEFLVQLDLDSAEPSEGGPFVHSALCCEL